MDFARENFQLNAFERLHAAEMLPEIVNSDKGAARSVTGKASLISLIRPRSLDVRLPRKLQLALGNAKQRP